jgi:methionyl-tRNA formyltransferase
VTAVYVAGAPDSVITEAVRDALRAHPAARIVGLETAGRVDRVGLAKLAPDLLISAGHPHFIPASVRAAARLAAVGVHPSLLPRYRGSWPLWWALRNGEREVGASLFHLADRIDAGPVIAQRRVAVGRRDTFASLYEKVRPLITELVTELVDHIAATGVVPAGAPQDEQQATYFATPGLGPRLLVRARLAARALLPAPPDQR